MKVKELIDELYKYPQNMPVKLLVHHNEKEVEFTTDNLLVTSEDAYIDSEARADTWDTDDGKIRHKGKRYLLINPIIN